ncbi:DUF2164 domain-containing protein [Martelella sp. HB161492]|uniref:DUF2164 domain-containing protein n=1 Tax=Martelella sp. HB161492 TaxID=2720726 RepID=UPI0015918C8B|nr:DUF2164 domain-containing protein [Martelella sp. HB161492]
MIEFSRAEKTAFAARLRDYLESELECETGQLQAELFFDFLCTEFGPLFYNQGLRDAHGVLMSRLDDLADQILLLEKPV